MLVQATCLHTLPVVVAAFFVLSSVSSQFYMESSVKGHIFLFFCLIVEKRAVLFVLRFNLLFIVFIITCHQINVSSPILAFSFSAFFPLIAFSLLALLNIYEKWWQLLVVTVTVIRSSCGVESFKYFWVLLTQQKMNSLC